MLIKRPTGVKKYSLIGFRGLQAAGKFSRHWMLPSQSCVCTLDVWQWSRPIQSSRLRSLQNMFSTLSRLPLPPTQLSLLFVQSPQRETLAEIEKSPWPKVTTKPNKWTWHAYLICYPFHLHSEAKWLFRLLISASDESRTQAFFECSQYPTFLPRA